MKRLIVMVMLAAVMAVSTSAQTPKMPPAREAGAPEAVAAVDLVKAADAVPQVSAQDKQIVQSLDVQRTGYALAIAVLQEKLDAVNAELGRTVQRLQVAQPGYELGQGLVYVKKPEPVKAPAGEDSPK